MPKEKFWTPSKQTSNGIWHRTMALKLIPDQDQVDAIQFSLGSPYNIIALQMGMGKTLVGIAVKDSFQNRRCLVICPSYLVPNWPSEIEKSLDGQVVTVFKKHSDVYYPFDSDFVIVSYDIAIRYEYLFEWANMVLIDEATALKSMTAKRTTAIHKYIFENNIPRVHLMTGTPIKNRVAEFYSLIAICNYNPKIVESKFLKEFPTAIDFADRFSHRKEFDTFVGKRRIRVVQWEGLKNEEELRGWLKGIYISRKSKMPPISFQDIRIGDFDDSELLKEYMAAEEGDIGSVKTPAKVAAAIRKVPMTVQYVRAKIENGEVEGPIIIYTDHVESCELLAQAFEVAAITGKMSPAQRHEMKEKFQAGEIPVLVATIGSFSSGYTLTRSNYMVFNDFCWTPGDMDQCYFRINRKGQDRPCFVDRLFGSKQDEYIFRKQIEKYNVIKKFY